MTLIVSVFMFVAKRNNQGNLCAREGEKKSARKEKWGTRRYNKTMTYDCNPLQNLSLIHI